VLYLDLIMSTLRFARHDLGRALVAAALLCGCAARASDDADSAASTDALSSAPTDAQSLVGYALSCVYIDPSNGQGRYTDYAFFAGPVAGGGAGPDYPAVPQPHVQRRRADLPGGSDVVDYSVDYDGKISVAGQIAFEPVRKAGSALSFKRMRANALETCSFAKSGVAPFQGNADESALLGKTLACHYADPRYGSGSLKYVFFATPNGRPTAYAVTNLHEDGDVAPPPYFVQTYFGTGETFVPYSVAIVPDPDGPSELAAGANVTVGKDTYSVASPSHRTHAIPSSHDAQGIDLTCTID